MQQTKQRVKQLELIAFTMQMTRLIAFVGITTFWLFSILVIADHFGLLTAAEYQDFAVVITWWKPIMPIWVHIATVLTIRPPLDLLLAPDKPSEDAWKDHHASA